MAIVPLVGLLEVVRSAYYSRARHPLPPAIVEALWIGWFVVLVAPGKA